MRRLGAIAVVGVTLLLAGCQSPSLTRENVEAPVVDDLGEARTALAERRWPEAAAHLRRMLIEDPANLFAHYHLAVCANRLGLRPEAAREFEWVLANAPAASEEARMARIWLVEAGVLTDAASMESQDPAHGDGGLRGTVTWAEPGEAPTARGRTQLFLIGLPGTPSKDFRYVIRADADGGYEFRHVAAGLYKLTNVVAGRPTWRLRVQIEARTETTLNLSRDNGVQGRDDFPCDRGGEPPCA